MNINEINKEDYKLYDELLYQLKNIKKGTIMSGVVTGHDDYFVFVDLSLKADGQIPKEEFYIDGTTQLPQKGEVINVLLESMEDNNGNIVISYSKALRQAKWSQLEQYFQKRTSIEGTVIRKVHGGCIVNIFGISAFLPKTHFLNDIKDPKEMVGKKVNCTIIKMDANKSNIMVSAKNSNDMEILSTFSTGQIVNGIVKTISDSYSLIELAPGILGKLHIKDLSWNKVENITDVLTIGETIQVKIMTISEPSRIELSIKDIEGNNPWLKELKALNFEKKSIVTGNIIKIDEKIIQIQFNDNIFGNLHISETAWYKKYQNFNEYNLGQEIKTIVIDINTKNNKLILSVKKLPENSLEQFAIGTKIQGKVTGSSDLGYIINIKNKLDGIIPNSAYYIDGSLQSGQNVEVYVHNTDNQQIILGTKKPN